MPILPILAFVLLICLPAHATETTPSERLFKIAQDLEDQKHAGGAAAAYRQIIKLSRGLELSDSELAEAHYRLTQTDFLVGNEYYEHLVSAADLGHLSARTHLGNLLLNRVFGEKPDKRVLAALPKLYSAKDALRMIQGSAEAGDVYALTVLSDLSRNGKGGMLKDPIHAELLARTAYEIVRKRSDQGDPNAMVELAKFTNTGFGTEKNPDLSRDQQFLATQLFEKHAEAGDIVAMRKLARRFEAGLSPLSSEQNVAKAIFWHHRLVSVNPERFDLDWLANKYRDGKTLPRDLVMAHAIYNFSSTLPGTDWAARQRDEIETELSDDDLARALSISRMCLSDGVAECLAIAE